MTANILKELKGVNFSCTSPYATPADQHFSMLMTAGSSRRAIDRFSPHLRDPLRAKSFNPEPPQTPSRPKVHHTTTPKNTSRKKSKDKPPAQQLVSPASSSRYLLGESASDADTSIVSVVVASDTLMLESAKVQEPTKVVARQEVPSRTLQSIKMEQPSITHEAASASASASASNKPQNQQVVVLRVSLHCKGCEGKVRKHLSKMEGVTSFATDLVNKKVTVTGDVTPLGVLNSISKVKNAQLWRSLPPKSS